MAVSTIQTGAHQFNAEGITKYSLMMGGLNVTHDSLAKYDPLVGGYYRIFMVRKPAWVDKYFETSNRGISKMNAFKHILEYGNLGVSGIEGIEVETDQIQGGYANRSFEVPKLANDGTNTLTIKVPEFQGSPMREVLHTWVNGSIDTQSAFAHYYGLIAAGVIDRSQANQTAEFIYAQTDQTGHKLNYACMFANCFPKNVPADHFNGQPGEHDIAQFEINFTCTKYEGIDVNYKALELLSRHQIMVNSMEFYSHLDDAISSDTKTYYNASTGELVDNETTTPNSVKDKEKTTLHRFNISDEISPKNGTDNSFSTDYYGNNKDASNGIYTTPSFTVTANKMQK